MLNFKANNSFFQTLPIFAYHYGVISSIINFLGGLSLKNTQRIGRALGILSYAFSSRYRELLNSNLHRAAKLYGFEPKPLEAAKNAGMMLSDSLWIWKNPEKALALTQINHWDLVEQALSEGKGLLLISPHLGAFEMAPLILAEHFPATVMFRQAKQKWLEDIMRSGRERKNISLAPANMSGVRQISRALQKGETVGILPDQVPGVGEGVWAKFFGRHAYTAVLPTKIARHNKVPTLIFRVRRLEKSKGWVLDVSNIENDFDIDPKIAATQLNKELEKAIIEYPHQYLWGYNRYKHPAGAELPPAEK